MDLVAQSVRASDCGSEGRGFDPHPSPTLKTGCRVSDIPFFISFLLFGIRDEFITLNPYRNPLLFQEMF